MTRSLHCLFTLQLATAVAVADEAVAELSLHETESRLRSQVATQFRVAPDEVTVAEAETRTWPDSSLGCVGRRRPASIRTPGYRFVLVVGGARATFHADTHGRILRCDAPTKPLDPIAR